MFQWRPQGRVNVWTITFAMSQFKLLNTWEVLPVVSGHYWMHLLQPQVHDFISIKQITIKNWRARQENPNCIPIQKEKSEFETENSEIDLENFESDLQNLYLIPGVVFIHRNSKEMKGLYLMVKKKSFKFLKNYYDNETIHISFVVYHIVPFSSYILLVDVPCLSVCFQIKKNKFSFSSWLQFGLFKQVPYFRNQLLSSTAFTSSCAFAVKPIVSLELCYPEILFYFYCRNHSFV